VFLAAPTFGSEAAEVLFAFKQHLWKLLTVHCVDNNNTTTIPSSAPQMPAQDVGTGLSLDLFSQFSLYIACLQILLTVGGGFLACVPAQVV
jgi:hypothetical protein